jgi:hypothetical protein
MPKSPLDDLPPADPKAFRRAIKLNLVRALQSLATFSDSVRDGRTPDWPPAATYALFMAQLRAFRLISKRKENAPAIRLMREIDRTWHKLKVVGTVESCIEYLQRYIGNSLLASAIAKAPFERQNDPAKDQLISLVCKRKLAGSEDLGAMRNLLPKPFQQLDTLASGEFVKRATGASGDPLQKLRTAVARSAQEYLFSEHQRFLERYAAAKRLRKFIFGLKYRPYTQKLFGFSQVQIDKWKDIDFLEAERVRQRRFRQKTSAKSVTLHVR